MSLFGSYQGVGPGVPPLALSLCLAKCHLCEITKPRSPLSFCGYDYRCCLFYSIGFSGFCGEAPRPAERQGPIRSAARNSADRKKKIRAIYMYKFVCVSVYVSMNGRNLRHFVI